MSKLCAALKRLLKEEDAPTMAEYALLLVFLALTVAAGALVLGEGISTLFNETWNSINAGITNL